MPPTTAAALLRCDDVRGAITSSQDRGDINDSDFDFCDTAHGDVLGIFAGIANQASNPYFNIAASVQNMTSAQWLASYF